MADTYYAWAPVAHKNEDGSNANLTPGQEVPSDLLDSLDDETKKVWIRDGVIRKAKYPKGVPLGLSVRTHLLREANKAFEEAARGMTPDTIEPQTENPSATTPAGESPTAGTQAPTTEGAQESQQ